MKKYSCALLYALLMFVPAIAQDDSLRQYTIRTEMIPMRDGVHLFTTIVSPSRSAEAVPILLQRTPYSATLPANYNPVQVPSISAMAKDGYIFVYQDIRGKYKSEGNMQIHQPLVHATKHGAVDESTDTWDTIDWLVKHVEKNNGRVGIFGISYPGWLALVGAVDPHPALRAASEQACMGDLFLGDDFHHNGAFRLSYGLEYSYEIEHDATTDSDFPFPQFDLFEWYLKLGSLKNVNKNYFHDQIPTWNSFVQHPAYDAYWQVNSPLSYVSYPQIPMLHVGGYFDQEDLNGPQLMYAHMEKKDSFNRNFLVLGPWFHGQWARGRGDSIGRISFQSNTSEHFQQMQKQWFDHWLKGTGSGTFPEATCFQTGSNTWKTYDSWPPKDAKLVKLYAGPHNRCSFTRPSAGNGSISFISDPAKPVPYRTLPIEATYGTGSRWRPWQVEDQRFVSTRPDVVNFVMDTLTESLQIAGRITVHLFASTTGSDADWIVKLIDVYPNMDPHSFSMSGYQLPVAMEVFRGRFRKGFSQPAPLTPGKPEEFVIDLHQVDHQFLKGHRIMIQIQSTWFPVIDRNPQKFVPNIFEASDDDFIKATHTIYFSEKYPTCIDLPVIN
jgi:uncharacterized protein